MMKSGIGESITKAQKEVGDCGTGAETPKDTRSGRTKCTRSHVTSQPKLQDKIPDLGNRKSELALHSQQHPLPVHREMKGKTMNCCYRAATGYTYDSCKYIVKL